MPYISKGWLTVTLANLIFPVFFFNILYIFHIYYMCHFGLKYFKATLTSLCNHCSKLRKLLGQEEAWAKTQVQVFYLTQKKYANETFYAHLTLYSVHNFCISPMEMYKTAF